MEEVRELKDGEEYKFYNGDGKIISPKKDYSNKIIVDSEGFEHSINDKPTHIEYRDSGIKWSKCWRKHGIVHRLTGPAYISYDRNGELRTKKYFIEGNQFTQEEFETQVNRYKLLNEL